LEQASSIVGDQPIVREQSARVVGNAVVRTVGDVGGSDPQRQRHPATEPSQVRGYGRLGIHALKAEEACQQAAGFVTG
jgi:hypothetical protein